MAKCNHDCFNCILPDCKVNTMTKEERKATKERDENYFTNRFSVQHMPRTSKYRYSR